MRIRSACSANRKLLLITLVTFLLGTLFSTMNTFGEDGEKCIEGDCLNGKGTLIEPDGSKDVGSWKNGMFKDNKTGVFAQKGTRAGHGGIPSHNYSYGTSGTSMDVGDTTYHDIGGTSGTSMNIGNIPYHDFSNGTSGASTRIGGY